MQAILTVLVPPPDCIHAYFPRKILPSPRRPNCHTLKIKAADGDRLYLHQALLALIRTLSRIPSGQWA